MSGETFFCDLCSIEHPKEIRDVHHIVPREYGGTNDQSNLANLCSGVHQSIHRIARVSEEERKPLAITLFGKNANKGLHLVLQILRSKSFSDHTPEFIEVKLQIPIEKYRKIKESLSGMFSKRTKKASVKDLLHAWIDQYILARKL